VRTVKIDIGNGQVAEITEPERSDFDANPLGAIQFALAYAGYWVARHTGNAMGVFLGSGLVSFLERIEPHLVEIYTPLIDGLLEMEDLPDYFRDFLEALKSPESEAASTVLNAVLGSAAGGATGSLLGAVLALPTYAVNRQFEPARPSPVEALAMDWRMPGYDELVLGWLKDTGWSEELQEGFREIVRPRPSISDLISWAWREHQDPEVIREELEKRGYQTDDIDKFMELSRVLPGVGDLIRMAVREAFSPEAIARYGLGDRFPDELVKWAEKQGLSEEWARRYWYAHWVLPSPTAGFEMLHRGIIDREELRDLLIYADYVPWWVEKLIEISYTPYTRVDARRMHKLGVLSDDELVGVYKDIGYDDEHAKNMARFTILYNMEAELEYTKSEVLKGYRLGMMSRAEANELLIGLGNSPQYADYLLDLEDYKRINSEIGERLKHIKTLYIAGEIDRTEATSRLGRLDLEADRIARYLDMWTIAREAKTARPTRAMIEEYYKDGIIDEATVRIELAKRHYQEYVIDWMITDWDQEIVDKARKEAERAQKEQERMAKAEFKTDLSMALANLNRKIAELKLLIAEWKVTIIEAQRGSLVTELQDALAELNRQYWVAETDEERQRLEAEISQLQERLSGFDELVNELKINIEKAREEIARLQLEKARLPVVLEERG